MKPTAVLFGFLAATAADAHADDTPLTLPQAYQLALHYSDDVAIAKAQVTEANITARATWNELTPAISASAEGDLQRDVTIAMQTYRPGQQFVAGATISQPVFRKDFFALRDASARRRESATAALAHQRDQLARDVADAYIDVVRTRSIELLDRAAVERTVALRENTVGRVKAGSALRTAELLAQLDVQRAQRTLVSAQHDVGVAEAAFFRLVGRAAPPKLELPPLPAAPEQAAGLETSRRRRDLEALQLQIQEADAARDAAASRRFWPKLDIAATVQYFSPDTVGPSAVDWRVVGLITIPLLQNGNEYSDIALRENEARIATLQLEAQRKAVIDEVAVGAVAVKTSAQTAELADQQLKTAREHYNLVEKQFKLGAITFLEVANAEAVLAEAENAYETARADRVRAVYDYLFAVGALDLGASSR